VNLREKELWAIFPHFVWT